MPQISYSLAPIPAVPGQLMDLYSAGGWDILAAEASEALLPGYYVELTSTGLLQYAQDTHANWPPSGGASANTTAGVVVYDLAGFEQNYIPFPVPAANTGSTFTGYPKGALVPYCRKGRMWGAYDGGGTPVRSGAINVWHSSDGTHAQGLFTFSATATTSGAEIDNAPAGVAAWDPGLLAGAYTDGFGDTVTVCGLALNLS